MNHQPVMVHEILSLVKEPPQWLFDATFGRGGHSQAFFNQWPQIKIIAFDQDHEALQWGKTNLQDAQSIFLYHNNFHLFDQKKDTLFQTHSIQEGFDIILLDLGVSSPQLDHADRGFSFYNNGPLDMRMNTQDSHCLTADQIVNQWDEIELIHLFQTKGEIRNPKSVVREIIKHRAKSPIQQTLVLSQLIERVVGWRKKGKHPATSYFLALRLEVNQELEGLKSSLPSLIKALKDRGRIFVLSFHSLEDRIVKYAFKESALRKEGVLVNKKVIQPLRQEVLSNPRSRSAKLRVFERQITE